MRTCVMIMAGGTGGHVFPALAVAEELRSRDCELHWLGTASGIEARLVPAANIPLHVLDIGGLRGKGWSHLLRAPWRLTRAVWQARRMLREHRPHVVLGMGGYASGPGAIAARLCGMPLVIHEQNARVGTTNRYLAKIATRVLTAFPDVLPNAICIGNPVRSAITQMSDPQVRLSERQGPLHLLVLGGSLGAKAINELVPRAVQSMVTENRLVVRHQTGIAHCDATQKIYRDLSLHAEVTPFIDDMAEALEWADLVVCRAGALTVAELSAAGVASLLVPFPFAIDDHQTANANWLVAQGAAEIRQQRDLNVESLRQVIEQLSDRKKLIAMAKAARAAAKPHATQMCAQQCLEVKLG